MSTVAEQLRQARLARNLTIEQVADTLKIRTDHVRALEEGEYNVFSAPVYVRGFVRTYGKMLKLDVPQLIAALEKEMGTGRYATETDSFSPEAPSPLDRVMLLLSRLDWRKTAVVLAVLVVLASVILGSMAWRKHRNTDPLSGLEPGVYQPTQSVGGQTLPLPPAGTRR